MERISFFSGTNPTKSEIVNARRTDVLDRFIHWCRENHVEDYFSWSADDKQALSMMLFDFGENIVGTDRLKYRSLPFESVTGCIMAFTSCGSAEALDVNGPLSSEHDRWNRDDADKLGIPHLLYVPFDEVDECSDVPSPGNAYLLEFWKMADGTLRPCRPYRLTKI